MDRVTEGAIHPHSGMRARHSNGLYSLTDNAGQAAGASLPARR